MQGNPFRVGDRIRFDHTTATVEQVDADRVKLCRLDDGEFRSGPWFGTSALVRVVGTPKAVLVPADDDSPRAELNQGKGHPARPQS